VAHVDHGKTTLADCLIAANGIIHRKQAGQLRLLDDRLDEQDRGITMKASSIALLHRDHLVNLIDSPGHLEFYSEVSAALRLTDAALLVVDTVEGVSSQTFRVLQQLYSEKLPAVLVLNKVDKLIKQCQMEPMQAYNHLNQVIEHVNAILGSFIAKEVGKEGRGEGVAANIGGKGGEQPIDALETHFYFSPEKKNVVFASALDNWGFSVESFSPLIAKKLGKQPQEIEKYLWGDYYYNTKTKSFSQEPRNENEKPLCVEWVLKPIWDIFENVENDDQERLNKVIAALNLKVGESARKAKGHVLTKEILSSWLPLDRLLLDRIVEQLPNPIQAQQFRLPYLLQLGLRQQQLPPNIEEALSVCSISEEVPLVAFVSKMVTFSRKQVNERGLEWAMEGNEVVIGFGRVYAGRVRRGQEVFVIGAKPKKVVGQNGEVV
jgi:ribosome assembly protein 1